MRRRVTRRSEGVPSIPQPYTGATHLPAPHSVLTAKAKLQTIMARDVSLACSDVEY